MGIFLDPTPALRHSSLLGHRLFLVRIPVPFLAPATMHSLSPSWNFSGLSNFPGPSSVSHPPQWGMGWERRRVLTEVLN